MGAGKIVVMTPTPITPRGEGPPDTSSRRVSRNRFLAAGGCIAALVAIFLWMTARRANDAATVLPHGNAVEMSWLQSVGGPPADSGLARAITSNLSNALGAVEGLRLVSAPEPGGIGADSISAPVGMRLSGTVQREGDRVRVNLRLASARNDSTLWIGRYDGKRSDLLTLEDEIASGTVIGIKRLITPP